MSNAPLGDPMRALGVAHLDDHAAMLNLVEALRVAESAARQLAFLREHPGWLQIQNNIARMRTIATSLGRASG